MMLTPSTAVKSPNLRVRLEVMDGGHSSLPPANVHVRLTPARSLRDRIFHAQLHSEYLVLLAPPWSAHCAEEIPPADESAPPWRERSRPGKASTSTLRVLPDLHAPHLVSRNVHHHSTIGRTSSSLATGALAGDQVAGTQIQQPPPRPKPGSAPPALPSAPRPAPALLGRLTTSARAA